MGREKMIWGRENCKNSREKKYNGAAASTVSVVLNIEKVSCVQTL